MKTLVLMRNDKGEGSRGGKIIGHTSSGKPIYATKNFHIHPSNLDMSSKEHEEARDIHSKHAKTLDGGDPFNGGRARAEHHNIAKWHKRQSKSNA